MIEMPDPSIESTVPLRRRLGLPLLVLYGTGITIGAGIYVLVGQVAGHAGAYAPWSFVVAATVMALTVASYAELSTRFPVSAGEAAYVMAAFQSRRFATAIGLMTVAIGVISSATVTLGSAGYIQQFINLPPYLIAVAVVLFLGGVAAWGILESVLLASVITVIETGGLLVIIIAAIHADLPFAAAIVQMPPPDATVLSGIAFGSLLAFFAFIGFEDLANVVEEARVPHRDIPSHGPDAADLDDLVCAGCGYRGQRRIGGTTVIFLRAAQSCVPRGCRCQSGDNHRDRHCCDAEHDPRTGDDGGAGDLRPGAGGWLARLSRAGASAHRHATDCHRVGRGIRHSVGAAGPAHGACGDHRAGDPRYLCAGQSCLAAASVSSHNVIRSPHYRPGLGTGARARDLRRDD